MAEEVLLSPNAKLEFGAFIGGGGGAVVVRGGGLMSRAHASLKRRVSDNYAATIGLSYIDITGSSISTPAFSFGITSDTDFAMTRGHSFGAVQQGGRVVRAIKPLVKKFRSSGNIQRSGTPLGTMTLMGFEALFASSPDALTETFFRREAQLRATVKVMLTVQVGYRWKTRADGLRAFGDIAAGFGGGGDVDIGANFTTAFDGDLDVLTP